MVVRKIRLPVVIFIKKKGDMFEDVIEKLRSESKIGVSAELETRGDIGKGTLSLSLLSLSPAEIALIAVQVLYEGWDTTGGRMGDEVDELADDRLSSNVLEGCSEWEPPQTRKCNQGKLGRALCLMPFVLRCCHHHRHRPKGSQLIVCAIQQVNRLE